MNEITHQAIKLFAKDVWMPTVTMIVGAVSAYYAQTALAKFKADKKVATIQKKKSRFIDGIVQISHAYGLMDDMARWDYVDSVLFLRLSNGGAVPKLGSKLYATPVKAFTNDDREHILERRYEGVEVDAEYIQMCIDVASGKDYIMEVETHKTCLLKSIYQSESVVISQVYHLYTDVDANNMYILSVRCKDEQKKELFNSLIEQTNRHMVMENIRRIFETNDAV